MTIWEIVQTVAAISSVALLVIGFRKNDRKMLLASWICLGVAFWNTAEFVEGLADGFEQVRGS
jgi:hypothetical protein